MIQNILHSTRLTQPLSPREALIACFIGLVLPGVLQPTYIFQNLEEMVGDSNRRLGWYIFG